MFELVSDNNLRTPLENVIKEGIFVIDADLASRVLDEARVSWQRKIRDHHVARFEDILQRGTWYPSQIAFGFLNGRIYLVNGYNRLTALSRFGGKMEVQILILECKDEQDLRNLYHRFDVVQSARSVPQILEAIGVSDEHGISKKGAKAVYDATALIMNGFERLAYQAAPVTSRSVDKRLEAAQPWWEVMGKYEELVKSAPRHIKYRLYNQGCSAVGLVTLRYQPEVASDFWYGLAENDGLAKKDPRNILLSDMNRRRLEQGVVNQSALQAAIAWNAWFQNRTLTIIKIAPNMKVRILGTPFDGSRKK